MVKLPINRSFSEYNYYTPLKDTHLKSMLNTIVDIFRKKTIYKLAAKIGQDCDGDIIIYKDVTYYHHMRSGQLLRVIHSKKEAKNGNE